MSVRPLWARFSRRSSLLRRGKVVPFAEKNRVELLVDGGPYFRRYLETIQNAAHYVFVEAYIVDGDGTGWRVAKALAERARAGVEVALCFDAFGSLTLSQEYVDYLLDAGVKILRFRPLSLSRKVWPWSRRTHRKLLVVDGRFGVVGGMNIADEYAATDDGGKNWRDTGVLVEGPAVRQLEALFRRVWRRYGGVPLLARPRSSPPMADDVLVRFMGNFARRDRSIIRRAYVLALLNAQRTIRICNAYFVPDRVFTRALIRAARRGVKVEIIVAGRSDVPTAVWATRWYYGRLLRHNVRIFEWNSRVLHAKTAVIDGEWVTIGSFNLDYLSSFRNLEVNAGIFSPRIGAEMDAQFDADLTSCVEVVRSRWIRRPWFHRVLEWFFGMIRKAY